MEQPAVQAGDGARETTRQRLRAGGASEPAGQKLPEEGCSPPYVCDTAHVQSMAEKQASEKYFLFDSLSIKVSKNYAYLNLKSRKKSLKEYTPAC